MRNDLVADLAQCSEFRQTLQCRPPGVVHGTALLLAALLLAAVAWAALTEADLVVRARGQVRPLTTPFKVTVSANGETLSATSGGRVIEVCFREGDEVRQGQVLVKLDTGQLDREIAKRQRTVRAGEEELHRLAEEETLQRQQFEADRAEAEAKLAQSRESLAQARERRQADIDLAKLELEGALLKQKRLQGLVPRGGSPPAELEEAVQKALEARQKLRKAEMPVSEGEVEVARRARDAVGTAYEVKRNQLETRRGTRQGEVDAAQIDLAKLEQERRQATLLAPIDGVVTRGDVKVGEILERGQVVAEVAEQKGFRFEAQVSSEEVGQLRVGLPVRLRLDAFDYQKYGTLSGKVRYIAPDATVPEGQHTAVYVVRIDVDGDEVGRGEARGRLKLGMAGQADIVTGRESLLSLLVRKVRQSISLG
jgi:multidrug efflux pump subunit AcrA (membrane-fusion protein)